MSQHCSLVLCIDEWNRGWFRGYGPGAFSSSQVALAYDRLELLGLVFPEHEDAR